MKRTLAITGMLILVAGIAGSLWYRQRVKEATAREQSLALQSQVQTLETELERARTREPHSPAAVPIISTPRANTSVPAPESVPAAAKAAPNPAMLNDPETRALMRKQQEQALGRLADKIVSKDFSRNWKLLPEQTTQVKDLVREKAAGGKDLLTAMMFDGLDDNALAQRGRETKQRLEQADAALRSLLGADGFNALTAQERSLEDRERVKRFREELAAGEQPLTQPQQESLVAAMSAERQGFTFRVDYSDVSKVDFEHVRDYFSEANLQTYFEDMQQLNARIVERAGLFLSPAQLEALKIAQNNQMEQARLTVKMTTELFNKRRAN
jgi:hypothetical protein